MNNKKFITFNSIQIAWENLGEKGKESLRELFDIYRIAAQDENKSKIERSTFRKASSLYKEYRKLNRQNDNLLTLDNDFNLHGSDYTKALHQKNEKQEKKVRELAKQMGFNLVYYSHLATLQTIETKRDLYLNKII